MKFFTHFQKSELIFNCSWSLFLLLAGTLRLMGQTDQCFECQASLCEERKIQVGTICHQHKEGGALVYYFGTDGSCCFCRCSCVASDTPVIVGGDGKTKAMGTIGVGEQVLALQKNNKWEISPVIFSAGTQGSGRTIPYAIFLTLEDNSELVCTADHIFMLSDKKLRRADRLSPSDRLLDNQLKPVKIKRIVAGEFKGSVHNIAVGSWDSNKSDLTGHFINTKGVISGDFFVQSVAPQTQDVGLSLPQVGTEEYALEYKPSLNTEKMLGLETMHYQVWFNDSLAFKPYKPVAIPKDAIHFLPPRFQKAAKGSLLPLDNPIPHAVADYIIYNYQRFFPDVKIEIDWSSNEVNAYAWVDENRQKRVALKAGLVRHIAMGVEGIGLVVAHELGHHFGGEPRYTHMPWASCEGQADYWGAMVCQRLVWWGEFAKDQIQEGAKQLNKLFTVGLDAGDLTKLEEAEDANACDHPPASCRLRTYLSALDLTDKPGCAGVAPATDQGYGAFKN